MATKNRKAAGQDGNKGIAIKGAEMGWNPESIFNKKIYKLDIFRQK